MSEKLETLLDNIKTAEGEYWTAHMASRTLDGVVEGAFDKSAWETVKASVRPARMRATEARRELADYVEHLEMEKDTFATLADHEADRIANLRAERDELKAEIEKWLKLDHENAYEYRKMRDQRDELRAERDELRARLDRDFPCCEKPALPRYSAALRAVLDLADQWDREMYGTLNVVAYKLRHAIIDAMAATMSDARSRAAEPITVSRGKYADALAAVQLCIYEAKVGDYDIDPFELEDHITEHIGEDDD